MTEVAIERINIARERGEPIPPTWALGPDGEPTTDPEVAAREMILQPFGGYKAFGLGLMTEILTSALAGGDIFAGAATGFRPLDNPMRTSFTLVALDLAAFDEPGAFEARVETMIDTLKAVPAKESGQEILFPGERSGRAVAARRRNGVPVAPGTMAAFAALCDRLGVSAPSSG